MPDGRRSRLAGRSWLTVVRAVTLRDGGPKGIRTPGGGRHTGVPTRYASLTGVPAVEAVRCNNQTLPPVRRKHRSCVGVSATALSGGGTASSRSIVRDHATSGDCPLTCADAFTDVRESTALVAVVVTHIVTRRPRPAARDWSPAHVLRYGGLGSCDLGVVNGGDVGVLLQPGQ